MPYTSHECQYCYHPFPTRAGRLQHIWHTPDCLGAWHQELASQAQKAFGNNSPSSSAMDVDTASLPPAAEEENGMPESNEHVNLEDGWLADNNIDIPMVDAFQGEYIWWLVKYALFIQHMA